MKNIIITGAGSGIGRATARAFLDAGWNVGLVGRRADALAETADANPAALVLPCDVTQEQQVEDAFAAAVGEWGNLGALFNNAGASLPGKLFNEITLDEWRNLMEVNLTGSFICARAAFSIMRNQDPQGGRIINNGSVSAHVPRWGSAPYTSSKHAITGMTRSISLDGRAFKIACGQIDIGNALTELSRRMTKGVPQADGSIAVEPMMDVAHIASSVLHMASLPLDANVQFMTVMAPAMPYIGRG
ncbi:MAG: SDR family oxidoreductase [Rhodobacter sp.]|nr:SDR family oxidoreductase [Rhodobacter sp.]